MTIQTEQERHDELMDNLKAIVRGNYVGDNTAPTGFEALTLALVGGDPLTETSIAGWLSKTHSQLKEANRESISQTGAICDALYSIKYELQTIALHLETLAKK